MVTPHSSPLEPELPADEQSALLLAPFRDLDGIWGAFVLSTDGDLLVWDVPRAVGEEALDEVAPRVMQLRDALAGSGPEIDFCVLRFMKHRLCFRATPHGVICAVTAAVVNLTALRMAMTVAGKRLARMMTEA